MDLLDLPEDVLVSILTWCTVHEVLACTRVCRALHCMALSDRVWFALCRALWVGKQQYHSRTRKSESTWKAAYIHSLVDSKRVALTLGELERFSWIENTLTTKTYKVQTSPVIFRVKRRKTRATIHCGSGDMEIKGTTIPWSIYSHRDPLLFPECILVGGPSSRGLEFKISRNAIDWGWVLSGYSVGIIQTYDPSCIADARPIVVLHSYQIHSTPVHGRFSSLTSTSCIDLDVAQIDAHFAHTEHLF